MQIGGIELIEFQVDDKVFLRVSQTRAVIRF